MSEVQEYSVDGFLKGEADHLWTLPYLDAYKILVDYHLSVEELPRTTFRYANGLFTDPLNNFVNPYSAPVDLTPELENPNREFSVSDFNASFKAHDEDQRWVNTSFPFTTCTEDYLGSLSKKKRANFKQELAKELAINPNLVIERVSVLDNRWFDVFKTRSLHYEFACDCYPAMYVSMRDRVKAFIAVSNGETIGAMVIVNSGTTEDGNDIWYSEVFSSLQPCARMFHRHVIERVLAPGDILHYGAAFSFDPSRTNTFTYKNALANDSLNTPYMLMYMPEPAIAPYYCLLQKKWIV